MAKETVELADRFSQEWINASEGSHFVQLHLVGGVSDSSVDDLESVITDLVGEVEGDLSLKSTFVGAVKVGPAFPQVGFKVEDEEASIELGGFLSGFMKGRHPSQGFSIIRYTR